MGSNPPNRLSALGEEAAFSFAIAADKIEAGIADGILKHLDGVLFALRQSAALFSARLYRPSSEVEHNRSRIHKGLGSSKA
jgi:hypothetical protein